MALKISLISKVLVNFQIDINQKRKGQFVTQIKNNQCIRFIDIFLMQNNTKKSSASPHLQYRQDINGLRGIAIILVVISHGWWSNLPSGKIGVDIFFVMSGYLISSIIFRERSNEVYTIWKFYSRRIKRLAPALVLYLGIMLFIIQNSFFSNDRARMRQEGSHIMASILMAQNLEHIRMDFNNEYISTVTTHFWSLGIQQQFYIFWPLVTGLVMKFNVKIGSLIIVGLICLSIWLQLYLEVAYIGWRLSRFIPFSRFWQFLVGCLLAYVQFKRKQARTNQNKYEQHQMLYQNDQISENSTSSATEDLNNNKSVNNLQNTFDSQNITGENSTNNTNFIGISPLTEQQTYLNKFLASKCYRILQQIIPFACMCIIYISARARIQYPFINNRYVQHAGLTYAKPVLAAAILIMTKDSFFNKKILSNKLLQFFGDVSYPLYLWHAGLQMSFNFNGPIILYIYLPALIISWISMKYIEPFFRRNQQKWVIPFLIFAQAAICFRGYQVYKENL